MCSHSNVKSCQVSGGYKFTIKGTAFGFAIGNTHFWRVWGRRQTAGSLRAAHLLTMLMIKDIFAQSINMNVQEKLSNH